MDRNLLEPILAEATEIVKVTGAITAKARRSQA